MQIARFRSPGFSWVGIEIFSRAAQAVSMTGTYPPGNGRPRAVLERRADLQFYWPAACGELQTPAKLRPVDRVSGSQFLRSLRRSRVHAEYRARGARPASSDRVNRPPGADWAPLATSPPAARQLCRAANTDGLTMA